MDLAGFVDSHKREIIERWSHYAVERLSLRLEHSQLLNDLPQFLDGLVAALRAPSGRWPHLDSAESHGRQRMRMGVDIGGLVAEMALVGETIVELASEEGGVELAGDDVLLLMRVLGHGTATSASAYGAMRDQQLADQAAQHFSFIAHEVRNPLHNARVAAEVLRAEAGRGRAAALDRLDRSLSQLAELVDDFLVEARFYGEPELSIARHRARELVDAACQDVAPQAEQRGLSVRREVEEFELDADAKILLSALTNLLKNAVKFTREGGRIAMRARTAESRALFEVEDACGGMPEDLPSRLFEPFVQANAERGGFGLGLVIVKQAAESHGGSVRVVNRPGEGCCFVLELPLRRAPPA